MKRSLRFGLVAGVLSAGLGGSCSEQQAASLAGCDGITGACLDLRVQGVAPAAKLRIEFLDGDLEILGRLETPEVAGEALIGVPAQRKRSSAEPREALDTTQVRCLDVRALQPPEFSVPGALGARVALEWPTETPLINRTLALAEFQPPQQLPFSFQAMAVPETGLDSKSFAIGDVDGDGKLDLVVASSGDNGADVRFKASVLYGDGKGGFAGRPVQVIETPHAPYWVAISDLNQDQRADLVLGSTSGVNGILVSLQDGPTKFGPATVINETRSNMQPGPITMALADLDKSGADDMIVAYEESANGAIWTFKNNIPTGGSMLNFTYLGTDSIGRTLPIQIVPSDINGDGRVDLVYVSKNTGNNAINVSLTNATNPFKVAEDITKSVNSNTNAKPALMAVADVDADGALDLIVTNNSGATLNQEISVFRANPQLPITMRFQDRTEVDAGASSPRAVTVADFDRDRNVDIAVAFQTPGSAIAILRGDGKGSFKLVPKLMVSGADVACGTPWMMSAADLNGDGKPDLVVACETGNAVQVFLNSARACE